MSSNHLHVQPHETTPVKVQRGEGTNTEALRTKCTSSFESTLSAEYPLCADMVGLLLSLLVEVELIQLFHILKMPCSRSTQQHTEYL